ncbi:uncharacterized protein LOC122087076 isoform X2 [Macadamia integrifolia]|uniref:uncharacterized protein LOC122087076 isoform X2 n=1 Tax=Macadamia integrifolia TaxID=60698 RepID=UPI001C4FB315|nr:uncharacterized protein LOC122087076 isoform X2 [Macadamia integrifolia]
MAGSTRFELTSSSPEGSSFAATYSNGQRGNYSAANLDRPRSFREGMENRMLSSGPGSSRGSNTLSASMPPLSQCLLLEQVPLSDQKLASAVQLRRAMGVNIGNTSEDHSVGAAHSKVPPSVAIEDLKRVKLSISDARSKARERLKTLDDSIIKLDKYCDDSRKKQRNELLSSERSGGTNLSKMGGQIQNRPGLVTQRMEERTKNAVPNKRVRTSVAVAEVRAEGRNSTLSRQPGLIEKERDVLRAGNGGSVLVEEKIRGLPAGAEGWEKKMKRKRSVGTVVTRGMDGDREVKRAMHQKLNSDPRSRSCDAHGFRSGTANGITGMNKLEGASQPTTSNARVLSRNELESASIPRDRAAGLDKERVVAKANNKLNIREDSQSGSPSAVTKGKVSRAPRTGSSSGSGSGSGSGSVVVTTSSPNFPRSSGVLDAWEQPPSINKAQSVSGTNNRKRLPTGSSSPPMAQWFGQRPPKNSRTRRANLVPPVSNTDEAQISSESFPPSDIGGRLNSNEPNGSVLARGASNNTQQCKMKLESVPSPARLSESEESGAGENKFIEKGLDNTELEDRGINAVQKVGPFSLPTKKNKIFVKEEIGDGVRRQGRSGRSSSLSRVGVPPVREKSENTATTKPLRSTRPGCDKNERSGRPPLKKLSERKAFARPGHVLNSGSSDFMGGESDDDHEELLTAANSAHSASYHACSGSFWKKMESIFASVSSVDAAFLKKQINFAKELDESLRHMFGADFNVLGELGKEVSLSQPPAFGEKQGSQPNGIGSNEFDKAACLVDQSQGIGTLCGGINVEGRFDKVTPLYQRVLSALIGEDVVEEFDRNSESRNVTSQYANEDSPSGTCNHVDIESKYSERMESDIESEFDPRTQKRSFDFYSCNGSTTSNSFRSTSICKPSYNDELWQADDGLVHSEAGVVSRLSQTNLEGPQDVQTNISGISSSDYEYQQMSLDDKLLLELQSIGLYPETVPDLAEGEEEINKDIVKLKKGLYEQVGKKKDYLFEMDKAVQRGREMEVRDLEQVAMNKLVEMAYKKHMACRGSHASKSGVNKVSRQVAMAFVNRTLARCQKFEDTGISCFSEPALRDVLLATSNDAKTVDCVEGAATNLYAAGSSCQPEARASATGAFSSMVERNGPHSDKLERGSSGTFHILAHSSDPVFAKHEPILNRGKKREVLLDDVVGSATSRVTSALGNALLGGAKGKRSERERDLNKDTLSRNSAAKGGRPLGNFRGVRKNKTKPKQKTAQLSTSGNGLLGRLAETTHPVYPSGGGSSETVTRGSVKASGEMGLVSPGNTQSKETGEPVDFPNLPLHELDPIEGLGVSNDLGGNQDLSSWLNFDEDGLQDHDSMGLEIPMDDLSDLNMLI